MKYIIVDGRKTLAFRGQKEGLFVIICGKEPEFLSNVDDPLVIVDRDRAEAYAKSYGGKVREFCAF